MQDSVDLPVSGQMTLERVKIDAIDGGAIGGSGRISFRNSTLGIIHTGAVSIASMDYFGLSYCTLGLVMERAVRYQR